MTSADDVVQALIRQPSMAFQVAKALSEFSLAGPWVPDTGIDQEYGHERSCCRRHTSGTRIATIYNVTHGVKWQVLDGTEGRQESTPSARAAVDAHLLQKGWLLASRGDASPWGQTEHAWVRKADNAPQTVLGQVMASGYLATWRVFEFALSDYRNTRTEAGESGTLESAQGMVDAILKAHGWELSE